MWSNLIMLFEGIPFSNKYCSSNGKYFYLYKFFKNVAMSRFSFFFFQIFLNTAKNSEFMPVVYAHAIFFLIAAHAPISAHPSHLKLETIK